MSYRNVSEIEEPTAATSLDRRESSTKLEYSVHDVDEDSASDALYNYERARSVAILELILALTVPFPFGLRRGEQGLWDKSAILAFWRLLSDQMIEPDRFRPALTLWSATIAVLLLLIFFVLKINVFFLIIGVYFFINAMLLLCCDCIIIQRSLWRRERFLYEGI